MVDGTNGNGRAWTICTGCERTAAGICLDCPTPLDREHFPRRLRCATCWREHRRDIANRSDRLRYLEAPGVKLRATRRYRKKHATRRAAEAKARRDAERAKGPPTAIDRLYWRDKTKRWRQNMTPAQREAYLKRRRELRAAKLQTLEVAA